MYQYLMGYEVNFKATKNKVPSSKIGLGCWPRGLEFFCLTISRVLTWRARQDKQQSSKVQAPIHPSMLQNSAYFDRFSVICLFLEMSLSKFCVVSTYNLLLVHSLLLPSCVSAPETFLKISKYHTLLIIPIHPSIHCSFNLQYY